MILSSRCNFECPYCRRVGGKDLPFHIAEKTILDWCDQGLYALRLSGGEPLLYKGLENLVSIAKSRNVKYIAISSNGSAAWARYQRLINTGVNDFSISLDACCAEDGDKMAGGIKGAWDKVVENIRKISAQCYTTVGVVLTQDNMHTVNDIIKFAASLGVSDIRIIPAAQESDQLQNVEVDQNLLDKFPILRYRIDNIRQGKKVREIKQSDSHKCGLVLDDMAVNGNLHYPCIIYMREGGRPIGEVGSNMRNERLEWYKIHDTHCDSICQKNCLDVCTQYNNRYEELHQ